MNLLDIKPLSLKLLHIFINEFKHGTSLVLLNSETGPETLITKSAITTRLFFVFTMTLLFLKLKFETLSFKFLSIFNFSSLFFASTVSGYVYLVIFLNLMNIKLL